MVSRISRIFILLIISTIFITCTFHPGTSSEERWAKHTLKDLSLREKIAQMLVYHMRLDYLPEESRQWTEIDSILDNEGMGSLHVWGGEIGSALVTLNEMQRRSKIPILVQADLEYGLNGRFPGGTTLPWPMAITATGDPDLAYQAGRITGIEGRALGIHLALAPVVDVNNNPFNPIINTRSFGEDPNQVIEYSSAFMQGLHDNGMAATAKHFPGHGDTQTDSHSDLAHIPSDSARLWSVELKPFQAMIDAGVDAIMVGHLDAGEFQMEEGVPATLSPFWLQDILRKRMGFQGVIITDAMSMGGITRLYSDRYALIQTIKAGSDLIIQNYDFRRSVDYIEKAVRDGLITEDRINESVLRILLLKAKLRLHKQRMVSFPITQHTYGHSSNIRQSELIMEKAITLVKDDLHQLPLSGIHDRTLISIDLYDRKNKSDISQMSRYLKSRGIQLKSYVLNDLTPLHIYDTILDEIPDSSTVLINAFCASKMKKNRIFLSKKQTQFIKRMATKADKLILVSFGTPYLLQAFPEVPTYLCTYSAQNEMQTAAANALLGKSAISGKLPISMPGIASRGTGIQLPAIAVDEPDMSVDVPKSKPSVLLSHISPEEAGADPGKIMPLLHRALREHAWPGGVLLAGKDGKIFLHEYFGSHTYGNERPTYRGDIFDLASVTKVIATTSAAMKLYEDGLLHLDSAVVTYLPEFTGPDSLTTALKNKITVRNLLTHTSGLKPFKRFYLMEAENQEALLDSVFQSELDTLPGTAYIYSDIGLITLGKILEKLADTTLMAYTEEKIFNPVRMVNTGFLPKANKKRIVPTEFNDSLGTFIHGFVHDENSHSLGGITGHAGLFSTAMDLARFSQMMLNGGRLGDTVIFKPETIELFTRRANVLEEENSRCLGWDSPSDSSSGGVYLSSSSYGHTGFTGTSIWIDPENQIFVILLTNAVNPDRANKSPQYYDWRQRIHSAVYESLGFTQPNEDLTWRYRWKQELYGRKGFLGWLKRVF